GGGGPDRLDGGTGNDLVRSTFEGLPDAPIPDPPSQPPIPPPSPGGNPTEGLPPATDSGGGMDVGNRHVMTNGPGDGSLLIAVDAAGSFGTASTLSGPFDENGATYDPIGPTPLEATTTFESDVYFRLGATGQRSTLTSIATNASSIRGLPTEANSTFSAMGLDFALTQTFNDIQDSNGMDSGSLLTQTYVITNSGNATASFEMVRYVDGDLQFDGTLIDGGGRLVTAVNDEILFETDAGGGGSTATTFLGITGKGGTVPTIGRFEILSFSDLRSNIEAGMALADTIQNDNDGDQFVDLGSEFDVTLGFLNTFSLAPGETDSYTTHTIFGTGAPTNVGPSLNPPTASDNTVESDNGGPITVDVVTDDVDQDGVVIFSTLQIVQQPQNGTAVLQMTNGVPNGLITYTPNPGFAGTDSFTYTIEDNDMLVSNEATVSITVQAAPDEIVGDTLIGGIGDDTVVGSGGDDMLRGNDGNDLIQGGDGNDTAFGGSGEDTIDGQTGNDRILGQGSPDQLEGGEGDDLVSGGAGNDVVFGDDSLGLATGNDTVIGGMGDDTMDGGAGDDNMIGGSDDDSIFGNDGNDTLRGQAGLDTLDGGNGEDTFLWTGDGEEGDTAIGGEGADTVIVRGDATNETFQVSQDVLLSPSNSSVVSADLEVTEASSTITILGSVERVEVNADGGFDTVNISDLDEIPGVSIIVSGGDARDTISADGATIGTDVLLLLNGDDANDTIIGSLSGDTINGGDGDDTIFGRAGNDTLLGGLGDDSILGEEGNDHIDGQDDTDTLRGGDGDDSMIGGAGIDSLTGDAGNDTLRGNTGNDKLVGNSGDDVLSGGIGRDSLIGGNGNDTLNGGRDDDRLNGQAGDDLILGDHGDDTLNGNDGNDTLNGGDGDDILTAGNGDDGLVGDDGNDLMVGNQGFDTLVGGDGDDTMNGGANNDILIAGDGDDFLNGQGGNDTGNPGEGDDELTSIENPVDDTFMLPQSVLDDLDAMLS
ncbi:MAG: hypothetical protein CMJ78_24845, partial [Planctomycetaceae bacterium]|nr:hypothetical protein [Planctomycetaceae bacterium]